MLVFFAKKIPQTNVTNSRVSQASHLHALRNAVCLFLLVISGKPKNAHKLWGASHTWLRSGPAARAADAATTHLSPAAETPH